jgi:hypothetical protein
MTTNTLTPAETAERDTYLRRINICAPYIRTIRNHGDRARIMNLFTAAIQEAEKEWGQLPADAVKWP